MKKLLLLCALGFCVPVISGCDILAALGGGEGMACSDDQACPAGLVCYDQQCRSVQFVDATRIDAGPADRARVDAAGHEGGLDAALPDRGAPDRLPTDGAADAPRPDVLTDRWPAESGTDAQPRDALSDRPRSDVVVDRPRPDATVIRDVRSDLSPLDRPTDAGPRDLFAGGRDASRDRFTPLTDSAVPDARAPWWNASYGLRRRITVQNGGLALTQYQVFVQVAFVSGMHVNFEDVRFVDDSGVALDHWLRSASSGVIADFWVELASVPAGASGFWLYYGNPSATSASNGWATFPFFDNFEDGLFDSGRWQVVENTDGLGTVLEQNDRLELTQTEPNRVVAVEGTPTAVSIGPAQGVALTYRLNTKLNAGSCRTQTPSALLVASSGTPWLQAEYRGWTGDVVAVDNSMRLTTLGKTSAQTAQIVASTRMVVLESHYSVRWIEHVNSAPLDGGLAVFNQTVSTSAFAGVSQVRVRLRLFVGGDTSCQQSSSFTGLYLRACAEPEPTTTVGAAESY